MAKRLSQLCQEIIMADCPPDIQEALEILGAMVGGSVAPVKWNDRFIGAAMEISVHLPTRGPVNNLDIREKEPIILLFDEIRYPQSAPLALSDRLDFPRGQLPHVTSTDGVALFCLHRGDIDDWFVQHSLSDFVERVRGWLSDAACGRLTRPEDSFEPLQLGNSATHGFAVYDPDELASVIRKKRGGRKSGSTYYLCHATSKKNKSRTFDNDLPSFYFISPVLKRDVRRTVSEIAKAGPQVGRPEFGLLLWMPRNKVCNERFPLLPSNYAELEAFTESLGFSLKKTLHHDLSNILSLWPYIPLVLAIQRPQQVLGTISSLEFLNCILPIDISNRSKTNLLNPETPVFWLHNRLPFTKDLARHLSNISDEIGDNQLLLLGGGALGSKIGMHLAKAGMVSLTIADNKSFSPHNLVRHALLADQVGENKAKALVGEIDAMYQDDTRKAKTHALSGDIRDIILQEGSTNIYDEDTQIVDCSASRAVLSTLVDPRLKHVSPVVRCEIADNGAMGLLMIEGENRSPRLDDLQVAIYDCAVENDEISAWLQTLKQAAGQFGSTLEDITIGLGCSSATMRMADDVVSYHAAIASMMIKRKLGDNFKRTGIQISYCNEGDAGFSRTEFIDINPVTELPDEQGSNWRIRIPIHILQELKETCVRALPNETGGILIGSIHHKRRIIYISRSLPPPPDSQGWPYAFRMGIKDIPEQMKNIHSRTGGLINYAGEWHSHPDGSSAMSSMDKKAAAKMSNHLKRFGSPTHIIIVTTDGAYSHIM